MDIEAYWLKKIATLKVDKARGDPAPHKPLLLLVLLDLAEEGMIEQEILALTGELAFRICTYWTVVAARRKQRPEIRMPFHHLSSGGFWTALTQEGRPSPDRKLTAFAKLDNSFLKCIQGAQWVSQGFNYAGNAASQGWQTVVNWAGSASLRLTLLTTPGSGRGPQLKGPQPRPQDDGPGGSNTEPMVWVPVLIPSSAVVAAFDFTVAGDPVDDVIVCGIGTKIIRKNSRSAFAALRRDEAETGGWFRCRPGCRTRYRRTRLRLS
jgi:hypothetical protein